MCSDNVKLACSDLRWANHTGHRPDYETKRKGVEVDSRLVKWQNCNINRSACPPAWPDAESQITDLSCPSGSFGVWFKELCYEPTSVIN